MSADGDPAESHAVESAQQTDANDFANDTAFPRSAAGTRNSPTDARSAFLDTGSWNAERLTPSLYGDVAALLDGGLLEPVSPVLLHRTDGHALFYAGQVNLIFGDPESGKTLLAAAACAEALAAGRRVFMLDMDHNTLAATVGRLITLGAPEQSLRSTDRFLYAEPDDKSALIAVVDEVCQLWRPAVAVVDSVGEMMPLLGLSSNNPDDFTVAHSTILKPLSKSGAAVLAIDHPPKGTSRVQGPTGTAAKRRVVGGASIHVVIDNPFTPGNGGSAFLTVNKDRHGGLRAHCPTGNHEPIAGTFVLTESERGIEWSVNPATGSERPALNSAMPSDVLVLDSLNPPPTSVRDVMARAHWGTDRAMLTLAAWRARPMQ